MNPFLDVNWNPSLEEKRRFALSLAIGFPFLALALLLAKRLHTGTWQPEVSIWLAGAGFVTGALLYLLPGIARPFYMAWYALGCCLGLVFGNAILSAFFFLVITPLGLVLRACGHRPIRKGFDKASQTYWEPAEKVTDVKRYYRQF